MSVREECFVKRAHIRFVEDFVYRKSGSGDKPYHPPKGKRPKVQPRS